MMELINYLFNGCRCKYQREADVLVSYPPHDDSEVKKSPFDFSKIILSDPPTGEADEVDPLGDGETQNVSNTQVNSETTPELFHALSIPLDEYNDGLLIDLIETYNLANEIHEQVKGDPVVPPTPMEVDNPKNFDVLPKADKLSKLSVAEFEALIKEMYSRAEINVARFRLDLVEKTSKEEAIKKEANRLLDEYKSQI